MKDYSIKVSKLKALIRSWYEAGISSGDAMKLMTLYLGVEEFLDSDTKVYPKKMFNKIRKANGYRSIPTLMDMIRKSESFKMIVSKRNGDIIAFCSPLICDIESVADGDYFVANGDSNYLNKFDVPIKGTSTLNINFNSSERTNLNNRIVIEGQGPLGKPLPELDKKLFLQQPRPAAVERVKDYLDNLERDYARFRRILYPVLVEVFERSQKEPSFTLQVVKAYLKDRVEPVFRRRKGIENWSDSQIDGWLQSLHQPRLAHIKAYEAMRNWKELHEKRGVK